MQGIDTILQTLADFAFSIASILTQGIVLLIDAMVPIMTYNGFVKNPIVTNGWAITRDTVNMFYVIVLIAIAFGTIFGYGKFKWQQQVPHLLIFAIVINFSKTLCGIMIDFGQVIMLTFANALREIAAGNFIQLFGLNQLYSLSATSPMVSQVGTDGASGAGSAIDFLASGVMSVFLTLWVLGTLVVLVGVLLYRIVGLWVLVAIVPLTWFVGGASGIIESKAYSEWWSRFKCLVAVGPILTFFLWLTLAVAGAGDIVANSGFDVTAGSNNAGFASTLLQLDNFLSFLIGIVLLMAGFDVASQFCSADTSMRKLIGAAKSGAPQALVAGLGLKAGSLGLKVGAKGVYRAPGAIKAGAKYIPGSAAAGRAWQKVAARQRVYGMLSKAGGDTAAGRFFAKKEGEAKDRAGIARMAQVKKEGEKLAKMSPETLARLGEKFARGGAWSAAGEAEGLALLDKAMGDKKLQKDLRASGALKQLWDRYSKKYEQDSRHDASKLDSIKSFKKSNADLTGAVNLLDKWEDAQGLDDDALKDKKVQDRLKEIKSDRKIKVNTGRKDENGKDIYEEKELNAYEAIEAGHAGANKKKALAIKDSGERFERMTDSTLARVDVATLGTEATPAGLQKAVEAATRTDDTKRAKDIIARIAQKHKDGSDEIKREMEGVMDTLEGSLSAIAGGAGVSKYLSRTRASLEKQAKAQAQKQSGQTVGEYTAPEIKKDQTADQYVEDFYKNSKGVVDEKKVIEVLNIQEQKVVEEIEQVKESQKEKLQNTKRKMEEELKNLKEEFTKAKGDGGAVDKIEELERNIKGKEEEIKGVTLESVTADDNTIDELNKLRGKIKEAREKFESKK
jgi:hypothetical protein